MSDSFSLVQGIIEADIVVKIVLLILIVLSIGTWSMFFQKISAFRLIEMQNKKFEKKFWSGIMLEDFYKTVKAGQFKSMYGNIFTSVMEEWALSDVTKAVMAVEFVKVGIRERVLAAAQSAMLANNDRLTKGIGKIAAIASISPFIGLFGTVWGVMNSFGSLSNLTSVTITAVAPGIAEALFSTAVGLFVALPAVAFHAKLSGRAEEISNSIDKFGTDLTNVLSRELDNFSVKNYNQANGINS
ncbi:MotA/TolQ/ExbB proton channel family protein [Candidatus Deianiraea vastatrix]|uniref:Biopolymer transport protein ExbB/TolQ n=1 Tax=Candidatus Deianiraea vastatrix TaxID=2163644 RepID=A0A5B8XE47_9RICK|nr:MotA/TolQ/ExbB proton channel family protein [Candidatus Deianiraea vastatrix]QED23510.1 Biopolymer transport protein ExbB/TolQ [Candidatus Deianiraea vastatrix]